VKEFKNWEKNSVMLMNISQHPEIAKSRFYQTKWEEINRLFITALDKALISSFIPGYYVDPSHTCMTMFEAYQTCVSCEEDIAFVSNFEKVYSMEEELWVNYVAYKTSSSTSDCTFDSYMFYNKTQYSSFKEKFEEISLSNLNNLEQFFQNQVQNPNFLNMENYEGFQNNYAAENIIELPKATIENVDTNFNNHNHNNNNFNNGAVCHMNANDNLINHIQNQNQHQNQYISHNMASNQMINLTHSHSHQVSNTQKYQSPIMEEYNHQKKFQQYEQIEMIQHSQSNDLYTTSQYKDNKDDNISIVSESTKGKRQKFMVNKNPVTSNKESKPKIKIQFFKDFNVKFTKRENIDKKILRKFRKFLKEKNKKSLINLDSFNINKVFWNKFIVDNLLPPMKYQAENVEYKSFNTNYMVWLMAHKGGVELYNFFVSENFESIISMFISKFNLKDNDELQQLKIYVKNLANIFYTAINDKESTLTDNSNEEVVPTTTKKTESIMCESTYNCIEESPNLNMFTNFPSNQNPNFMQLQHNSHINCLNGINSNMNNFDIFEEVINNNPLINKNQVKDIADNSFEKNEDLGKMFNNSFEDEYIFCDE
jgi:hypothetical protein